jgi:diguanylate cyclase (GGDEF)-like protein
VVSSQQLALAKYVADDVDGSIRLRKALLERLASELPARLLGRPQELEDWLAPRQHYSPLFSLGLVVVAADGKQAIADFPSLGGRRQLDYSGRDWFKASQSGASFFIGKPDLDQIAFQGVVNMSVPVKDEASQVVAVLMGSTALSMPGFLDLIQKNRIGESGSFLLFSPRDQIFVTATESRMRLKSTPTSGVNRLHDQAMQGWRGSGITVNAEGEENLAAFASVPTANWVVVARMPTTEALRPVSAVFELVVRYSAISAVILVLLLGLFLGYSFRPLGEAARRMRAMAEGRTPLTSLPVVRDDEVGAMVRSFNSLVEKLTATEAQMQYLAHHDALTGLPNRRCFLDRLEHGVALASRQSYKLALLFIDLDGFKRVNDDYGHALGDALLKGVAERAVSGVRQSDIVARLGGDEFVVLLVDCPEREAVGHIAANLIAALAKPFDFGGLAVNVGASIGIALYPDQSTDGETLLAQADSAMYEAKRGGRGHYRFAQG